MDEERRTKIVTALRQYRETVLQHNLFLLRILSPRGLLNDNVRTEFIRLASLDGVCNLAVNLKQREEYFTGLRNRIAEKNVEVAELPPVDLEYLCTLVSGITGPGLPLHREAQQTDFVSSIEDGGLSDMTENVTVPIRDNEVESYNDFIDLWEEWEVSIAFKIGGSLFWGGSYALYCRNQNNEQWNWRYAVHDGDWRSNLYDSVEEFLGFYAHFGEETEEDIRKEIRRLLGPIRSI
ncbi:hypothetical protein BGW36DRAFT_398071 [Talaromyces proteolyticus]|uniref:Uncharacterized protein n=1 Tax=Talaromyces proteolyticus TaxID=1131652 RepID=A0AAD4KPV7_9EURO|nr:uncharacterized protein BGW36DRAFT_398071 [Talaromyces proteolyticus]KAH8696550.1 hypothetical protein BGW36DRAFT_398071 [Talaromyces proteolyticus]